MKKIILGIVFVFASFTMVNANSNVEDKIENASNCASYARGIILDAAENYNLDISRGGAHFEIMMEAYHAIYADCYYN